VRQVVPFSDVDTQGEGLLDQVRFLRVKEQGVALELPIREELLDRLEGVRYGIADDEVDATIAEFLEDLERRVSAIEDEDVAGVESIQHGQQFGSFRAVRRGDADIEREAGKYIVESGLEHLGAMPTFRPSQCVPEFVGPSDTDLGSVARDNPMPLECEALPMLVVEPNDGIVEELAN
jgi:hypothetical protein